MSETPYWQLVRDGDEPVFHDSYSGHDWAEECRDAYWKALRECAAELEAGRAEISAQDQIIYNQNSELTKLRAIAQAAQSLLSEDGAKEALAHYVVLQVLADRVRDWEGK